MKFIKELNKTQLRVLILAVLIFISSIIFLCIKNYRERQIPSISYRVYTKENGWSKWCKDGDTCGDKKHNILNIQIRYPKNNVSYGVYSSKTGWVYDLTSIDKTENSSITGFQFNVYRSLRSKYDICYRSHNSKNKWLGWTCNGQINGNESIGLDAIEVKIVPKSVAKYDYLKEYNSSKTGAINFDIGGKNETKR